MAQDHVNYELQKWCFLLFKNESRFEFQLDPKIICMWGEPGEAKRLAASQEVCNYQGEVSAIEQELISFY